MCKDIVEIELKIKTKWGKFTLHKDLHTRTEKNRPWNKVICRVRIHLRRRQPTTRGQKNHTIFLQIQVLLLPVVKGWGIPLIFYADSNSDIDIPPHFPNLEEYCRTCISKKTKCICKPMSDCDADLVDITQPDCPNNNKNNDRDNRQDHPLPSDWSDQENFWSGKT